MDLEIALIGMVGASLLAGAAGVVWGRGTVEHETPLALMQLETMASGGTVTVDSSHVHEATSLDETGWHCDCGQHMHSYMFIVKDSEEQRCVCGATGTGKEWS